MSKKSLKDEILYLEMSDPGVKRFGHRYMFIKSSNDFFVGHTGPLYMANRAWRYNKTTKEISWVKNREAGTMAPLDKREFFIVQLAAMPIKLRWMI